jgi:hypothetical protein
LVAVYISIGDASSFIERGDIMHAMKKFATVAAALAMTTGATIAVAPAASADTCFTRGCGGQVTHDQNAGATLGVDVANCWTGSSSVYYGAHPPCTSGRYSTNITPTDSAGTMWFIRPGQSTNDYRNYYDTDAYKVGANCVLTTSGTTIDRRGLGTAWYKINGLNRIWVLGYRCF